MRLQGTYREYESKRVNELQVGDVIAWNYGYTSQVVELIPSKTGKTFTVMLRSTHDGIVRDRKMVATRLVAMA